MSPTNKSKYLNKRNPRLKKKNTKQHAQVRLRLGMLQHYKEPIEVQ